MPPVRALGCICIRSNCCCFKKKYQVVPSEVSQETREKNLLAKTTSTKIVVAFSEGACVGHTKGLSVAFWRRLCCGRLACEQTRRADSMRSMKRRRKFACFASASPSWSCSPREPTRVYCFWHLDYQALASSFQLCRSPCAQSLRKHNRKTPKRAGNPLTAPLLYHRKFLESSSLLLQKFYVKHSPPQ